MQLGHSPSTSTMQENSVFPPAFSARHVYWPSSSGRALAMVREQRPPAHKRSTAHTLATNEKQHFPQLIARTCLGLERTMGTRALAMAVFTRRGGSA